MVLILWSWHSQQFNIALISRSNYGYTVWGVTKKKWDCVCHTNQWLPIGKPVTSTICITSHHYSTIILYHYLFLCLFTRTWNEGSRKSSREKVEAASRNRQDAVWV